MTVFEIMEINDIAIIQAKTNLVYEVVSKGRADIFGLLKSMNFNLDVEIDLSEVEYIDSSGIGLLLTVKNISKKMVKYVLYLIFQIL